MDYFLYYVRKNNEKLGENNESVIENILDNYFGSLAFFFTLACFCLVGIRLKTDTLRFIPLEIILVWELVSERDGQLSKSNRVCEL